MSGDERPSRSCVIASWRTRLLAEATLAYEAAATEQIDDELAIERARGHGSARGLEDLVILRAEHLPLAGPLRGALTEVASTFRWILVIGLIIAMILGGAAARASLVQSTVSVFAVVVGLLGIQSLMLVLWLLIATWPGGAGATRAGAIGALMLGSMRWLSLRLRHTREHSAALTAIGVTLTGSTGRWTAAVLTHLSWLGANVGMLVILAVMFLGEGYQFRWDSTWLSDDAYERMVVVVASVPAAAGFETPDASAIRQSRRSSSESALTGELAAGAGRAWSWFTFGSVVVYGLIPRTVLAGLSIVMLGRARAKYRLDLSEPGFARLGTRLLRAGQSTDQPMFHAEHVGSEPPEAPSAPLAKRPHGGPQIVGIELATPATGWPPPFETGVEDLGIIDGRDDSHRILARLTSAATYPRPLIIVWELGNTPDRGAGHLLAELSKAASGECILLLTAGRVMARDADANSVGQRSADWRFLASGGGVLPENVIELDLDHLTGETRARLAGLVDSQPKQAIPVRRLESSIRTILVAAESWGDSVTGDQQLDLHRDIARLHQHSIGTSLPLSLGRVVQRGATTLAEADAATAVTDAAKRATSLLPPSLRAKPRWMAAGALAGALGCLAAASLISPVAIATLPTWSLIGAAVAAVLPTGARGNPVTADPRRTPFPDALRAACLWVVVLELQGQDEATISSLLAHCFDSFAELDSVTPDTLAMTLDTLRHRFDAAVAEVNR